MDMIHCIESYNFIILVMMLSNIWSYWELNLSLFLFYSHFWICESQRVFPSFVQDTPHFLSHIDRISILHEARLVTIDVEAIYSFILHQKGLQIVCSFLGKRSPNLVTTR